MTLAPIWSLLRTRVAACVHDLLMIPLAWLGALWLRFNLDSIPSAFLEQALHILPVLIVVQGGTFLYFGLYRGVWRFASVSDLVRIVQAVVVGVSLCAVAAFLITRLTYIPRASFPLYAGMLMILLSGPRLAYRWFKDRRPRSAHSRKALIVGAGRAGEILARALLRDPTSEFVPLGFVDDDPDKHGRTIHDVPVVGHCGQIPEIAARTDADAIIIAIPSASSIQIRRLVELCERANRPVRTVPNMVDLISGRAQPDDLRAITIEDLLNREPVRPDWSAIRNELSGRRILVTGGGGSIGGELCRQIARLTPARLIVMDNSEFNLNRAEIDLHETYPSLAVAVVLADVCDTAATTRIFERYRPDVVFHAAAYKQVPILESHVREAVRVNTLGTHTVANAAAEHGTDCFVLVSSDKAVNPVNAMGASKRLAEMVCQAVDDTSASTRFIAVRFGNVLDSAGSVVPPVQGADRVGGTGHGDRAGNGTLLHDHPRSMPAHHGFGIAGTRWGGVRARHGLAHADRVSGGENDSPRGQGSGQGHRHRVRGPAAGRKAHRGAVPRHRAVRPDEPRKGIHRARPAGRACRVRNADSAPAGCQRCI